MASRLMERYAEGKKKLVRDTDPGCCQESFADARRERLVNCWTSSSPVHRHRTRSLPLAACLKRIYHLQQPGLSGSGTVGSRHHEPRLGTLQASIHGQGDCGADSTESSTIACTQPKATAAGSRCGVALPWIRFEAS